MADVDMALEQPTIDERAYVQVKSKARQQVLDDYLARYGRSSIDRYFFVCHSPIGKLSCPPEHAGKLYIWTGDELTKHAIDLGLMDWLIAKSK